MAVFVSMNSLMLINFKEKCVFWVFLKSIHSLLLIAYPSGDRTRSGVHLDRSSVCRWAHTDRHTQTLTPLPACVWTVGGSWSNPRQPTLWSDGGFEARSFVKFQDHGQHAGVSAWSMSSITWLFLLLDLIQLQALWQYMKYRSQIRAQHSSVKSAHPVFTKRPQKAEGYTKTKTQIK